MGFPFAAAHARAWEEEHEYPSNLSGAIVCGLRKSCTFPQIQNGDVLLSVNRQGTSVELDKLGWSQTT